MENKVIKETSTTGNCANRGLLWTQKITNETTSWQGSRESVWGAKLGLRGSAYRYKNVIQARPLPVHGSLQNKSAEVGAWKRKPRHGNTRKKATRRMGGLVNEPTSRRKLQRGKNQKVWVEKVQKAPAEHA